MDNPYDLCYCWEVIAYELDCGNERLEEILTQIIDGVSREMIHLREFVRGIICSHNKKMHALLGKLLLAARREEGARQTICENADFGTKEAFFTLLAVINENNLIRFSSVKRAVGTWLGLLSEEVNDIARVSEKSVALITTLLQSEEERLRRAYRLYPNRRDLFNEVRPVYRYNLWKRIFKTLAQ